MKNKDLVEFRYQTQFKQFVKYQTHMTNVKESLAYGMKKRLETNAGYLVRFVVVDNGELQYSNEFPPHMKRRLAKWQQEIEEHLLFHKEAIEKHNKMLNDTLATN